MDQKTPMTTRGYNLLVEELRIIKLVERPKITKAIEVAREHGDLKENAEYSAAKEAQSLNEGRIQDVEYKIGTAQVVNIEKLSGERVVFGATVLLYDVESGEEKKIVIVGEDESDAVAGLISYNSPLARGAIGKFPNDTFKIKLPNGEKEFEILSVEFNNDYI